MDDSTLPSLAERLLPYGAVAVALFTPLFRKLVLRAIREEWPAVKEIIDEKYAEELELNACAREQLARMMSHQERAELDMQEVRELVRTALEGIPDLSTQMTRLTAIAEGNAEAQKQTAEAVRVSAESLARMTGEFSEFRRAYYYDRRSSTSPPFHGEDRRGGS